VKNNTSLPQKVISGGQTGSDQAGLIAAARFGIATGGWMPHGFETNDGPNPELAQTYGMQEHRGGYKERTGTNVSQSDGTIRIAGTFNSLGEKCTLTWLRRHDRPHIDVDMHNPQAVQEVVDWIVAHEIRVLNVAGNVRPKSRQALAWGIEDFALEYLSAVFLALGHQEQPYEQA